MCKEVLRQTLLWLQSKDLGLKKNRKFYINNVNMRTNSLALQILT